MSMATWRWLLPVLVLLAAALAVAALVVTREPPARAETGEPPARLVRTAEVSRDEHRVTIRATGTVTPAREVTLRAEVSGRVERVHERLRPGAVVAAGDTLVYIDPTDFQAAVAEAEARLAQAQAELALERGRSEVAAAEFDAYADDLGAAVDRSLALREPQLQSARAAVKQAEAQLRRARANLERTTIEAPFEALIRAESVDPGAQVGPQSQIAELVAVDRYWVRATLPIAHLPWIAVPGFNAQEGAEATVIQEAGSRRGRWPGRVAELYGQVTDQGRLAQVLVEVPAPRDGDVPLLLGTFVDVELRGRESHRLIELPRAYLREQDKVWVYADGRLEIRPVDVVWRAQEHVLVGDGLSDGERVVTSPLNRPVAGMRLRRADDGDA